MDFSPNDASCYHRVMIIDGISASHVAENSSVYERAIASFLQFIERKLGVLVLRDVRNNREDVALDAPLTFGMRLLKEGIIVDFGRSFQYSDEPQFKSWYAICNNEFKHMCGGTKWGDDKGALFAALAEAQERYIWLTQIDYFRNPTYATEAEISKKCSYISTRRIVGFSDEQRKSPARHLTDKSRFLWIEGRSLVRRSPVYIPARVVSGARKRLETEGGDEPFIRASTSIGLATWPEKSGAELRGALEAIEREAYMIMWLNQLTLPRYSLESIAAQDTSLAHLFAKCKRYLLKPHVISLITDAPTHAIAVVIEDLSGHAPRFSVGLNAHRSVIHATEKALTEAIRSHRGCRQWHATGNVFDTSTPVEKIGHRDRLYYWALPENAKHHEFMIAGEEIAYEEKSWEKDTEDAHLTRILEWCASKGFECVSVPLTSSKKNITHWHINMVIIPELQPTYLTEDTRAFGGTRWRDVPKLFGYKPLSAPFAVRPHPFS